MDGECHLTILLAAVLLQNMYCFCWAGFVVTPDSQTIEINDGVESEALFRCRHESVDAEISWRINGSSSRRYIDITDGFLLKHNGTRVDTLSIPAILQYNGARVLCRAQIDGSPEEKAPVATLTVIANVPPSKSPKPAADITSPASTTTSTTTSTKLVNATSATALASTATTTAPPPTTTKATSAPTSTANFKITPDPLTVAVEQATATFYCQHSSSDAIGWRVNGISLNRINPSYISINIGTITFQTLMEFHQTTVECVATFFDGPPAQFTSPVMLLIQDTPGPVKNASCIRNYSSSALITSWDSLPSLDINGTDPDIVFGVELYKITCGRDVFINFEVVNTSHTSNTIDLNQIYKAVISPRNNVEGARNGTSVIMEEKFISVEDVLFQLTRNPHIVIEDEAPVPSYYTMILKSIDGSQRSDFNTTFINVTREGDRVTLRMVRQIPPQTLWNVSIHAYDCTTDSVEEGLELSTHDVQNISVNYTDRGEIRVTGDIIDGSTVTGVLVIVYSQSDVRYISSSPAGFQRNIDVAVTGLTDTHYGVSTFTVENGVPFPRVVASPMTVEVDRTNEQAKQASLVAYTLQPDSNGVCINCTFMDMSNTYCVAVVHQRISQLNSSGLMNIESSHRFIRSGDTASGCIEGVNLEDYQVGVIGGRQLSVPIIVGEREGAAVCSGCIVGAVLGAVCFVTLAVIVAVIALSLVKFYRRVKLPLKLEEAIAITDPAPLERFTDSPSTIVTDVSSDSSAAGANDEDPADPTYDQPVFSPKTSKSASPPGIHADHNTTGGEDCGPTHVQSAGGPTYAQPQLATLFPATVPCPPAADSVVYDQVKGFQNSQGQQYAMLGDMPAPVLTPDSHPKSEYAVITQQQELSKPTSDEEEVDPNESSKEHNNSKMSEDKITEDQAFYKLLCYSSQWQSLGEALSLDEDHLDDIFTGNETDEACLREMLGLYFMRSDLKHSWEDIDAALKSIGIKSCTTECDTHHQPQPSDASQEKVEEEWLKQRETSGGQPMLQCFVTSKSGTSIEPVVDKSDMIQTPGNDTVSKLNSLILDVSEVHEKQESEGDSNSEFCDQEFQDFTSVHELPFSSQSGDHDDVDDDDSKFRRISNSKSPSGEYLDDSDGRAADETLVADSSPPVLPFVGVPMAGVPESVICQASDEDQPDYNMALKKLLHPKSGRKIRNQFCYHSANDLHVKQSNKSQSRPQVRDEIALQRSRTTVFQPSCTSADIKDSHLCDNHTNKQAEKLLSCMKFVFGHSSPLNELVLPFQVRCHKKFINGELRNG